MDYRLDTTTGAHQGDQPANSLVIMATNMSIRSYVKELQNKQKTYPSSWLSSREIPTSAELQGVVEDGENTSSILVPVNEVTRPWKSKAEYLNAHYLLLREDAVSPLRNVISELENEPNIVESDSQENASIYEKVHIIGFTFANSGIAAKITFSLRRAGKRVIWEQSKRLVSGSMVALTPVKDMFRTVCQIAIVAARPLTGVQQNPPEIDIFFAAPDELELDPQQEWVMAECRDGYFEAYRHTLRSLQHMATEMFPLQEHIVRLEEDIPPPAYVEEQPLKNLSLLYAPEDEDFVNVNVLDDWPRTNPSVLDASQFEALRRILTKRLAIIQGPPGTGKTHVSVVALDLLLRNRALGDAPIILAAHTNHAVDQLLRHVAKFEPDFIRLGGMTTDQENIKPRTLFEVRQAARQVSPATAPKMPSLARLKALSHDIRTLLAPLADGEQPLSSELFKKYGIITEAQHISLQKGAAEWVRLDEPDQVPGDMAMWLGRELIKADIRTMPEDFGFEFEEIDLEFEQLKEMEAETKLDDEFMDTIKGEMIALREPFTGRRCRGVTEEMVKNALEKEDLWEIDEALRGPVYRYMQGQYKTVLKKSFRQLAKVYEDAVLEAKIGRWEADRTYLHKARIIGMTTTGLSKYRALLQSLRPKIVLIEEAAETLEAYVTAACFPTLEHLILVGDHQQLRGHCTVKDLEDDPYFLSVSMFERLVRNRVGFSKMITQRRMIPEIRRALKPIYDELIDHESVLDRPSIPGMGGINTYFLSHNWPESSDIHMSRVNHEEAAMIVGFFDYLVHNGTETKDITVLTFYNGQRKLILRGLRTHANLQGCVFKVVTVDSYQGEENNIVLLSLVRNNLYNNIGFLDVENRVCVALSRAQRGFYIFGNATMLSLANRLWGDVVKIMGENPPRVGPKLPLTCKNHGRKVYISEPMQFLGLTGGCDLPCRDELPCGHECSLTCHPFAHDLVNCKKLCKKVLACGHECVEPCYLSCHCPCGRPRGRNDSRTPSPIKKPSTPQTSLPRRLANLADVRGGDGQAFRDFALGGHVQSDAELAAMAANELAELRLQQADSDMSNALFGTENVVMGQDMRLVRTASDANGMKRGVWKGTYGALGVDKISATGQGAESKGKENDVTVDNSKAMKRTQEPSLLD